MLTCAGSRGLGKMALTGLSRGDRQAFSLECLCFSAIWGEPGKDSVRYYSSDTHTQQIVGKHIRDQITARC